MEEIKEFVDLMRSKYGIPKFIPNSENAVYYATPYYDEKEIEAILETVMFGNWISSGEKVQQFEKEFSKKFNHRSSLMVNSGSSANLIMIAAIKKYFNWADNDEIILSVVGYPTTLSSVILNNLKPVFIDVEFDTLNFDVNQIESKITNKTKGIYISPALGNPSDFDELQALSKKYNIELILDNCDSLGSKWKDKFLTEYVICSTGSFYPPHHISTGEGGMISSDISGIMKIARSMVSWGRACECIGVENFSPTGRCKKRFAKWLPEQDLILDHKYIYDNVGYNLKPLDLQGAIGLVQLEKFDEMFIKRVLYKNRIQVIVENNLKDVRIINEKEDAVTSWFGVPIICKEKEYKTKLVQYLESNKIQTRNYFSGNILLHPAYKYLDDWKLYPNANKVLETVFFLGCSPSYNENTFAYINKILKDYE